MAEPDENNQHGEEDNEGTLRCSVELRSGGTVVLCATVDLLETTTADRDFIFEIVDLFRDYDDFNRNVSPEREWRRGRRIQCFHEHDARCAPGGRRGEVGDH